MKKARLIVAASETCADLLYASGFMAPDPFIWLQVEGLEPMIVINTLEYDRAVEQCRRGLAVVNRETFFSEGEGDKTTENLLVEITSHHGIDEVEIPRDFPVFYADAMREVGVRTVCAGAGFFPERACKNDDEIEAITAGLRAAEAAERRVAAILSEAPVNPDGTMTWDGEPLTSERMRFEVAVILLRHGGVAASTIVAGGAQGAQPHNAGSGPLYAGQPIVTDIFPRMTQNGYWGDITRTFVKGKAPKIVKQAFEAVRAARDEAKQMIRAGVKACEVHNLAALIMKDRGFPTGRNEKGDYGFIHSLGHGVGLEIHEYPRLSRFNDQPLEAGQVITVEPGLYYPEWGGIRIEDMVVVEKNGCRCLNDIDTFLEIK